MRARPTVAIVHLSQSTQ